jgi:hypothetical protein
VIDPVSILGNSRSISSTEITRTRHSLFQQNEKGKPKALRQLANAASVFCNGAVKTSAKPKHVYAVFIGYEPTLECFLMNSYLHVKFRPLILDELNCTLDCNKKLSTYAQEGGRLNDDEEGRSSGADRSGQAPHIHPRIQTQSHSRS